MGAAIAYSVRQDSVYEAESAIRLRDVSADLQLIGDTAPTLQDPGQAAALASDRMDDLPLARKVKNALRTPISAQALADAVQSGVELRTALVVIKIKSKTPGVAARVANEYARQASRDVIDQQRAQFARGIQTLREEFRAQRRGRDRDERNPDFDALTRSQFDQAIVRLETLRNFSRGAEVAQRATVPDDPVSPRPVRNAMLGGALGLALALMAAFTRDALDRRLRGTSEIRQELGFPIIGMMSEDGMGATGASLNGNRRPLPEPDIEAVRILRTNLAYLDVDNPPRTVAVTSALPEEGKSTVAAALALALGLSGKRTILLECDLRRPSLAGRLGLQQAPGLSDFLAGTSTPQEVLQVIPLPSEGLVASADGTQGTAGDTLVCVTAGNIPPRPAEMLDSDRMRQLLAQLRDAYDAVVLDTSPLLPVVDTMALLPEMDGIVLCVRSGQTTRDQAKALSLALGHLPTKPTGVVVTAVQPGREESYSYYSYAYGPTAKSS
ncbi:MAG: hypothetical protein H0T43_06880 [Solirubrobacterales bacterium]|nr:hypothetical protein [Solirubrobacterales bacterium]